MSRPPVDQAAYDASAIDWDRLRAFAARVGAARFAAGLGATTVLAESRQWRDHPDGSSDHNEQRRVLLADGSLVSRLVSWTEITVMPWRIDDEPSEHAFFDTDVTYFDHRRGRTNFHGLITEGDWVGPPIYSRRGIGLSAALKRLLPAATETGRPAGRGRLRVTPRQHGVEVRRLD